jgi:type 1 glutamine amidotransferase
MQTLDGRRWQRAAVALVPIACLLLATASRGPRPAAADASFAVLIFSRTLGYRHDSIPAGVAALRELGQAGGFSVDATENPAVFSDAGLAPYRAVVFLSTTGDVLDAAQQAAFERYIRAGGGFVGVHAASDTEYDWPWYGGLLGAYFASHPAVQTATLHVGEADHPSTKGLPASWLRRDEWYNFRQQPAGVRVLLRVDEASYSGGKMGASHPISWYHEYDGGRAWYTALGHTSSGFADPPFRAHLLGGIRWAAGAATPTPTETATATITPTPIATPTPTPTPPAAPDRRRSYLPLLQR